MPPVQPQQTIKNSVAFSGIGLHSGNKVTMTLLPAAPNSGIRFRRVDLDGKPEIEARAENVTDTNRSTTLAKGNVKVHTVEHVLATFAGYGIDNAIVELDSNEPPIADGSSREYCKMVQQAGIVAQSGKREPYAITEPIELKAFVSTPNDQDERPLDRSTRCDGCVRCRRRGVVDVPHAAANAPSTQAFCRAADSRLPENAAATPIAV